MMTRHGAPDQRPDAEKLAELIVYIANRSDEDSNFGVTKLNKILFYSDFISYRRYGRSITGYSYVRLPFGPCPKGGDALVRDLEAENRLIVRQAPHFNRVQRRVVARQEADLKRFTAEEIAVVEEVLDALRLMNASEVSDVSRRFVGWKLADPDEVIPYAASMIETEPDLTEAETQLAVEHARRIASRARQSA